MSRSGYSEYLDNWALIMWRGAVASAIRGKRGQAFLKELAAAMDAMPTKRLISHELKQDGEYCALGVLGAARGIDLESLDPDEPGDVASAFNIAYALTCEIVYENDECGDWRHETPEQRWDRMRRWVNANLKEENNASNC